MTQAELQIINGVDVGELNEYIESCRLDPARADRNPVVVARWVGGGRAEVTSSLGGAPVYMGGPRDPSALGMLLRSLAACDVEIVATTAARLGLEIEDLSVEARGFANVGRYLGLDSALSPGYQNIAYSIRLKTKGDATPEQLDAIRRACEEGSPVGDTLKRPIPLVLEFDAN
ncbi:MAG TPA: OsmC family protein [Candidatus Limnocylindrales bacterium]|nr:OsmC family protein [Candidatus Limnocylindrales bacterium]